MRQNWLMNMDRMVRLIVIGVMVVSLLGTPLAPVSVARAQGAGDDTVPTATATAVPTDVPTTEASTQLATALPVELATLEVTPEPAVTEMLVNARLATPEPTTTTPPGLTIAQLAPPGLVVAQAKRNKPDTEEEDAELSAATGGMAVFLNGRVGVIAEAGAFDEDVQLVLRPENAQTQRAGETLTPSTVLSLSTGLFLVPTAPGQSPLRFRLEAVGKKSARALRNFQHKVRVVFDWRGVAGAQLTDGWYIAYQDETDPGLWHKMPVTVHDRAGLISTETDHFSGWTSGTEPGEWHYRWQPPMVSTFSGAAQYQYPIALPPGRGGLTPNVDVSYSSRGVDSLLYANADQGELGLGWSIGNAEITRDGVGMYCCFGGNTQSNPHRRPVLVHPDSYSLILDGAAYHLKPAAANTLDTPVLRYYADDNPSLYIVRVYDVSDTNANDFKTYWVVKTSAGTVYRLGYFNNAKTIQMSWCYSSDTWVGSMGSGGGVIRWKVDTVTDMYGNQLQYQYDTWSQTNTYSDPGEGTGYEWTIYDEVDVVTEHSRLQYVRYNYPTQATLNASKPYLYDRVGGSPISWVDLVDLAPGDSTHRTQRINVYHASLAYRSIDLTLADWQRDDCAPTHTQAVTAITEWDGARSAALPVTTLSYVLKPHTGSCSTYYYLEQVNNGYGGRTQFTYTSDERVDEGNGVGYSYFVTQAQTWDGIHDPQAATTDYVYFQPCFHNGPYTLSGVDCTGPYDSPQVAGTYLRRVGPLRGFATVTITTKDYSGATLAQSESQFYQGYPFFGRAYLEQALDPAQPAQVLQQTATTYETQAYQPTWPSDTANFSYARWVTQTVYDGANSLARSTETLYDPTGQGNAQYGNVTTQKEYVGPTLTHCTLRGFYPNVTQWRVNQVAYENVYANACGAGAGGQLLSSVRSSYDGQASFSAMPTNGQLTAVRRWVTTDTLHDTYYTYDAWGNRTSESTYNVYGTEATFAKDRPGAVATTQVITFDPTYHLYPTALTNALNQTTQLLYDYRLSVPTSVTDPNLAVTSYGYDSFGRLTSVVRPGDSAQYPTQWYVYRDGSAPFRTEAYQREPNGEHATFTFYDGLGRTIQAKSESLDGAQNVVVDTKYDALGRALQTSTPRYMNESGAAFSGYTQPGAALYLPTTTHYDAFGRATRMIAPDGTTQATLYALGGAGQYATTLDANNHYKFSITDPLGRVTRVDETLATLEDGFVSFTPPVTWTNGPCSTCATLDSQTLKLAGTAIDFNAQVYRSTATLNGSAGLAGITGQAMRVEFKVDQANPTAILALEAGTYPNSSYRRLGVVAGLLNGQNVIYLQLNRSGSTNWEYPATLIPNVTPNAWYVLTLKVSPSGASYVEVWRKDDPSQHGTYAINMYDAPTYRFSAWVKTGNLWLDNYQELNFTTTNYGYTPLDQLTRVTDTLGNSTVITYNFLGQKIGMKDPDMGVWRYDYDLTGNLTRQIDALNQPTQFLYDPLNRLTVKLPLAETWHDDFSAINPYWSTSGSVTSANNQIVLATSASTTLSALAGTSPTLTDGEGVTVTFKVNNPDSTSWNKLYVDTGTYGQASYRRWGLNVSQGMVRWEKWDGVTSTGLDLMPAKNNTWYQAVLVADGAGQMLLVVWERDNPTAQAKFIQIYPQWAEQAWTFKVARYNTGGGDLTLDEYGEVWGREAAVYGYDDTTNGNQGIGQRTARWDDTGWLTWTYDPRGRVTKETRYMIGAGSFSTQYAYDTADRLTQITYPTGEVVNQSYNAAGQATQLTSAQYGVSYASGLTYNALGQLRQINFGNGATTAYNYYGDGNGGAPNFRLWRIQTTKGATTLLNLAYTYDNVGNITALADDRIGETLGFTYDSLDRLIKVNPVAGAGYNATYVYDAIGNLTNKSEASGAQSYSYDAQRPHATLSAGNTTNTYTANGDLASRREVNGTTVSLYTHQWSPENQLMAVTRTLTGSLGVATRYAYDGDGARAKQDLPYQNVARGVTPTTGYATPNALGRITDENLVANSTSYATVGSGLQYVQLDLGALVRVETVKVWHYHADARVYTGTKTQVSADGVTWYTVFDSAVSGKYTETAAGKTHNFPVRDVRFVRDWLNGNNKNTGNHWVEIQVLQQPQTIFYVGGLEIISATQRMTKTSYALGSQLIAMRMVTATGNVLYYFQSDHLGSTSLTMDANGAEVARTSYYAYGMVRSQSGNKVTDRGYTGQYADGDLTGGLMYYSARYYSPSLGKFVSADTIVPDAGNPQAFNRYSYSLNNPLKYIDPSGHCAVEGDENTCGSSSNGNENMGMTDSATLTEWGRKMYLLYVKYKWTVGWWNDNKIGHFTEESFIKFILSYEFYGLDKSDLGAIPQFQEDIQHASTHWFYSVCDCDSMTPNGIFNWLGNSMESARGRYEDVFDNHETLEENTPASEKRSTYLAELSVDSIANPSNEEWKKITGPPNDLSLHPWYWGNSGMFPGGVPPKGYLWKFDNWYLVSLWQKK